MAHNMKPNESTASRIDRVAALARERRGEEELQEAANIQASRAANCCIPHNKGKLNTC